METLLKGIKENITVEKKTGITLKLHINHHFWTQQNLCNLFCFGYCDVKAVSATAHREECMGTVFFWFVISASDSQSMGEEVEQAEQVRCTVGEP